MKKGSGTSGNSFFSYIVVTYPISFSFSLDFHDRETSNDIVSIPHMFSWQECGEWLETRE